MTETAAADESLSSSSTLPSSSSPVELASQIDASLKALLVLVGQSLRAKSRLQARIRAQQAKTATGSTSKAERALLEHLSSSQVGIPGIKVLERECIRYDGLVKQLSEWVNSAKEALEQELDKAKAREEIERIERLKKEEEEREMELKRLEDERQKSEAQLAVQASQTGEATTKFVLDAAGNTSNEKNNVEIEKEDDDDKPLSGLQGASSEQLPKGEGHEDAIDLTEDSPETYKNVSLPSVTSTTSVVDVAAVAPSSSNDLMTDPTALLATLTGLHAPNAGQSGDNSTVMVLDNFDFSQLGLQNMNPSDFDASQATFQADQLDLNMDFLDFNSLSGSGGGGDDLNAGQGGMIDSSSLFGNIDFSALLGGDPESKKE